MKYRILRRVTDKIYEDFGTMPTKREAEMLAKFSATLIGYKYEDYIIEEEE